MQSYPIPDEDLAATSVAMDAAVKAATAHRQAVVANCQAYAWAGKRAPTAAELRNMTYQSVMLGVKGMVYYTCFDEIGHLFQNKELWRECVALASELKTLGPALLDGERQTLAVETDDDVRAACWTHERRKYVAVCNLSRQRQRVTVTLPDGSDGDVRPLFAERPTGLKRGDRGLAGTIEPAEVHVYVLDCKR